jgi:hypothetical protein
VPNAARKNTPHTTRKRFRKDHSMRRLIMGHEEVSREKAHKAQKR